MRLWHKDLISVLPRQQLLAQWRECCCIAKNIVINGTPNHILVNKIMDYSLNHFVNYTNKVIVEMQRRNYKINTDRFWGWIAATDWCHPMYVSYDSLFADWHNDRYLTQCYYNLQEKYDCGGISEEEWERVEKFYINARKNFKR